MIESRDIELYIHVPYCIRKCAYCDFYSLSDKSSESEYISALCRQLSLYSEMAEGRRVRSVYVGGGTPTLLCCDSFKKIFTFIFDNFKINSDAEITVEANPATVDSAKASLLRELGVNRISLGCQSADDRELSLLSRLHNFEGFCDTFKLLRECGFLNISADLMFALPSQTNETLLSSIRKVCELSPEHISLYMLKIEPDTPFGRNEKSLSLPSEDESADMYLAGVELLEKYGYMQYEISNFAKKGYESRHNLGYWKLFDYLGAGPAASSCFDGARFCVRRDLREYIACSDFTPGSAVYSEYKKIPLCERESERIMLSLRLCEGCAFSAEQMELLLPLATNYIKSGYMKKDGARLSLTPSGMLVSNYIISEILLLLGL